MRSRKQKSGRTYYDAGGRPRIEIPLGPDPVNAVRKWTELERRNVPSSAPVATFRYAAKRYIRDVLLTKAPRSQADNLKEFTVLYRYFDDPPAPLADIKPQHIKLYMTWRGDEARKLNVSKNREVPPNPGHVRANREIALFSHVFNYAREVGLTDAPNPCAGVRKNKETGRDVYVEDDVFQRVWKAADSPTQDAMDLAYLTGQRPADTLKFDERDVREGMLHLDQNKTGKKLRITIEGDLAKVIARNRARKAGYKVSSTALVVNESGQRLGYDALRQRFYAARETAGVPKDAFQFRDLRTKAGTDTAESSGDIRQAQRQLGHKSIEMTERYVRERKGDKVGPTR
ncbi:tyrosine-type recombinase/integrase [Achromobacter deleyi]|nr:tyrosine-type recombinase/integrase [Achromobacter deleyi]